MSDKELKGDCVEFTGLKDCQGYGVVSIFDRRVRAHRLAFKLANPSKTLTKNMDICHKCDNPSCINPTHLFLGTHGDNNRDRTSKGRSAKGGKHGSAKLQEIDVLKIRSLVKFRPRKEIAIQFGISRDKVNRIVRRNTWRHI